MLKRGTVYCIGKPSSDRKTENRLSIDSVHTMRLADVIFKSDFVSGYFKLKKDGNSYVAIEINENGEELSIKAEYDDGSFGEDALRSKDTFKFIVLNEGEFDEENSVILGLSIRFAGDARYVDYSKRLCSSRATNNKGLCLNEIEEYNGAYDQTVIYLAGISTVGKSSYLSSLMDITSGKMHSMSLINNNEAPGATSCFSHTIYLMHEDTNGKDGNAFDIANNNQHLLRLIDMHGEALQLFSSESGCNESDEKMILESLKLLDVLVLFCEPIQLKALNSILIKDSRAFDYLVARNATRLVERKTTSTDKNDSVTTPNTVSSLVYLLGGKGFLNRAVINCDGELYQNYKNKRVFLVLTKTDQLDVLREYSLLPGTSEETKQALAKVLSYFDDIQISKSIDYNYFGNGQSVEVSDEYDEMKIRSMLLMRILKKTDIELHDALKSVISRQKAICGDGGRDDLFVRVFTVKAGDPIEDNATGAINRIAYSQGWRVRDPISAIISDPFYSKANKPNGTRNS